MTRRPRDDQPGTWHHVTNRGLAKRTMFEGARDVRSFLASLAREVRAARIRCHAFCFATTHFHLLVESPAGELSEVMREVQKRYVRTFNRKRRRDGPLVRGRFWSKPVRSTYYRHALVRYIDDNAVRTGLVAHPSAYPYGSAFHYSRRRGPPWLTRSWVEQSVRTAGSTDRYEPSSYDIAFPPPPATLVRLVDRRLRFTGDQPDPLDDLIGAAGPRVREWMERKAQLADETRPGLPILDCETVLRTIDDAATQPWLVHWSRSRRSAWEIATVVLLRDLAGATYTEIAHRTGRSLTSCRRDYVRHAERFAGDPEYARRLSTVAEDAIRRLHGTTPDVTVPSKLSVFDPLPY